MRRSAGGGTKEGSDLNNCYSDYAQRNAEELIELLDAD